MTTSTNGTDRDRNKGGGRRFSGTAIFMHLHKTGGTTLSKLLDTMYSGDEAFSVEGKRFRESAAEFSALPEERRRRYRIVKGHLFFGMHRHLPQPSFYVTFMREPLERALSNYYWVKERPRFKIHDEVVGRGMSFVEYLQSGMVPALDNGMTRMVAGADVDEVPYGTCGRSLLERAERNLRERFLVGLTGRFDESLVLFGRLLGWGNIPPYRRYNVTEDKPAAVGVSPEEKKEVHRYVALDEELYRIGIELFEAQVASMDDSFTEEVEKYRKLVERQGDL